MKLKEIEFSVFTPIHIEYNLLNGFIFSVLGVEIDNYYTGMHCESSLFGINASNRFLYISILYKDIKIFHLNKHR